MQKLQEFIHHHLVPLQSITPKVLLVFKLACAAIFIAAIAVAGYFYYQHELSLRQGRQQIQGLQDTLADSNKKLGESNAAFTQLQQTDQVQKNQELTKEIDNLQFGLKEAAGRYEQLLQLADDNGKKSTLSAQLTKSILLLSQRNYASASSLLASLKISINAENARLLAANPTVSASLPTSNAPPSAGFQRQGVQSDVGLFQVDVLAADLNSTRVVVETASSETCKDNCPVVPLADFVSRAGGYAGINGPYFCPAEYPSCAGKTNSFDTLLMNKQKTYFNSDNNVYSTVPAVIFSGSSANFVEQSLSIGRGTSDDAVIAAQPLLLRNGEIRFGGNGDPKLGSRGNRSFIGTKGTTVYIGVVHTATVAEVAHVLKTLGLDNALNLDSGGSTAFYVNGKYLDGPGRQTPFGIILVRK